MKYSGAEMRHASASDSLENQLHRQLECLRTSHRVERVVTSPVAALPDPKLEFAMFWDEPKVGVGEYRARRGEVRMIENVEEIAFEPEAQPLPDREVAVDGEVELLKVEAAQ